MQSAARPSPTYPNSNVWSISGAAHSALPPQETERLEAQTEVTIADPLPLGLAAFASATFTIGTVNANWFGANNLAIAIPVALIFGGLAQLLAGMWAFRRGNVLSATAFTTIGSFYLAWSLMEWLAYTHVFPSVRGGDPGYINGVFILTFCLIALYLGIAALRENTLLAGVLFLLALTWLCDGIGAFVGGENWLRYIGGYAGMLTALLAFYLSAAVAINSATRSESWPSFQLRPSTPR
jgi:succinate-acetate transporter protein